MDASHTTADIVLLCVCSLSVDTYQVVDGVSQHSCQVAAPKPYSFIHLSTIIRHVRYHQPLASPRLYCDQLDYLLGQQSLCSVNS